ncbi:MAG: hypothetical protein ABID35_06820 [Candidatus Margulisiibacteriota bacterium]
MAKTVAIVLMERNTKVFISSHRGKENTGSFMSQTLSKGWFGIHYLRLKKY